jgi:hypothetical protein
MAHHQSKDQQHRIIKTGLVIQQMNNIYGYVPVDN